MFNHLLKISSIIEFSQFSSETSTSEALVDKSISFLTWSNNFQVKKEILLRPKERSLGWGRAVKGAQYFRFLTDPSKVDQ